MGRWGTLTLLVAPVLAEASKLWCETCLSDSLYFFIRNPRSKWSKVLRDFVFNPKDPRARHANMYPCPGCTQRWAPVELQALSSGGPTDLSRKFFGKWSSLFRGSLKFEFGVKRSHPRLQVSQTIGNGRRLPFPGLFVWVPKWLSGFRVLTPSFFRGCYRFMHHCCSPPLEWCQTGLSQNRVSSRLAVPNPIFRIF